MPKKINGLNEIKKVVIKGKRLIEGQKKLPSLFNDLSKTIFNKTVNESNSSTKNKTVNESNSNNKNESQSDNKTDYQSDNESDNEGEKDKYYYEIRQLNNWFEAIDQNKSLEEQIKLLKERGEFLSEYWYVKYYHDNKEFNYKIFKSKAAHLLNELDDQLLEKILGYTFPVLVEKLINTVNKKENQIIIGDIENNRDKIYREYKFDKVVIKHSGDLLDAAKIILEINEALKSDKVLTSDKVNNDFMELLKI